MRMRVAGLALLVLAAAGCLDAKRPEPEPVTSQIALEVPPARVLSPNGSMALLYDGETNPSLTLSAGFMRRSPVGKVEPASYLSWAPNSERFYVNDSGSASWSRLRMWNIDARARAAEVPAISQAAVDELARHNACERPDESEYTTHGMGWGDDGSQLFVLAQVRREVNCTFGGVEYLVALIDVRTGRVVAVELDDAARRRWPTLPWSPVTAP